MTIKNFFNRYKHVMIHIVLFAIIPLVAGHLHGKLRDNTYKKNLSLFTPDNCWNRGSYQEHGETKYLYECHDTNVNSFKGYIVPK